MRSHRYYQRYDNSRVDKDIFRVEVSRSGGSDPRRIALSYIDKSDPKLFTINLIRDFSKGLKFIDTAGPLSPVEMVGTVVSGQLVKLTLKRSMNR